MPKKTYTNYNQLPLMLSVPDVAAVLGISRAGAYALACSRDFPAMNIGYANRNPKGKIPAVD